MALALGEEVFQFLVEVAMDAELGEERRFSWWWCLDRAY